MCSFHTPMMKMRFGVTILNGMQRLSSSSTIVETLTNNQFCHHHHHHLHQRRSFSISRMLDMGGAPSIKNDRTLIRTVNASKNSKLRAVAFDFEVLIKSSTNGGGSDLRDVTADLDKQPQQQQQSIMAPPEADLDQIKQVASLLKVDIDTDKPRFNVPEEINISVDNPSSPSTQTNKKAQHSHDPIKNSTISTTSSSLPIHEDIRAKYASKLKGGLAGLALAKSQVEDTFQKGDAAGHLAARKLASQDIPSQKATRWMAHSGTSKLLTYLTHRSIRIALLPNPKPKSTTDGENGNNANDNELELMNEFSKQLRNVVIDVKVPKFINDNDNIDSLSMITNVLQTQILKELNMNPQQVLLVSDRDEYLKAAKEIGMITCRLQPLTTTNARRGNITPHYTSPTVQDILEIVNEINGISFNAVLNR